MKHLTNADLRAIVAQLDKLAKIAEELEPDSACLEEIQILKAKVLDAMDWDW